jgi:proline iminopeptidase
MNQLTLRLRIALLLTLLASAVVGAQTPSTEPGELLPVNGTELYVQRIGQGEPILVVHGGPVLEHGYLLPHLAPLAEDYELIFYDQRLSGRSAPQVEPESVRIATFVEDIEGLRMSLGLGRVHLMAHSWGGLLALRYALEHEDRLLSLVLLDSMSASSKLWQEEQKLEGERFTAEDKEKRQTILASEAFKSQPAQAVEQLLRLSFKGQFHDPVHLDALQLYVPDDYMERSRQFAGMQGDLADFDFHEELGKLSVAALVLYGSEEPGARIGGAALHEALPGSKFVLLEGSGHFPFIEQPKAFFAAVRGFLAGL